MLYSQGKIQLFVVIVHENEFLDVLMQYFNDDVQEDVQDVVIVVDAT